MSYNTKNSLQRFPIVQGALSSESSWRWEAIGSVAYVLAAIMFILGSVCFLPSWVKYFETGLYLFVAAFVLYLIVAGHDTFEECHSPTEWRWLNLFASVTYIFGAGIFMAGCFLFLPAVNQFALGAWCFIFGSVLFVVGAVINAIQIFQMETTRQMHYLLITALGNCVGSTLFVVASVPYLFEFESGEDANNIYHFLGWQYIAGSLFFLLASTVNLCRVRHDLMLEFSADDNGKTQEAKSCDDKTGGAPSSDERTVEDQSNEYGRSIEFRRYSEDQAFEGAKFEDFLTLGEQILYDAPRETFPQQESPVALKSVSVPMGGGEIKLEPWMEEHSEVEHSEVEIPINDTHFVHPMHSPNTHAPFSPKMQAHLIHDDPTKEQCNAELPFGVQLPQRRLGVAVYPDPICIRSPTHHHPVVLQKEDKKSPAELFLDGKKLGNKNDEMAHDHALDNNTVSERTIQQDLTDNNPVESIQANNEQRTNLQSFGSELQRIQPMAHKTIAPPLPFEGSQSNQCEYESVGEKAIGNQTLAQQLHQQMIATEPVEHLVESVPARNDQRDGQHTTASTKLSPQHQEDKTTTEGTTESQIVHESHVGPHPVVVPTAARNEPSGKVNATTTTTALKRYKSIGDVFNEHTSLPVPSSNPRESNNVEKGVQSDNGESGFWSFALESNAVTDRTTSQFGKSVPSQTLSKNNATRIPGPSKDGLALQTEHKDDRSTAPKPNSDNKTGVTNVADENGTIGRAHDDEKSGGSPLNETKLQTAQSREGECVRTLASAATSTPSRTIQGSSFGQLWSEQTPAGVVPTMAREQSSNLGTQKQATFGESVGVDESVGVVGQSQELQTGTPVAQNKVATVPMASKEVKSTTTRDTLMDETSGRDNDNTRGNKNSEQNGSGFLLFFDNSSVVDYKYKWRSPQTK